MVGLPPLIQAFFAGVSWPRPNILSRNAQRKIQPRAIRSPAQTNRVAFWRGVSTAGAMVSAGVRSIVAVMVSTSLLCLAPRFPVAVPFHRRAAAGSRAVGALGTGPLVPSRPGPVDPSATGPPPLPRRPPAA